MNCSLLDDEDYVREVRAKISIWLIEGQNEFTDNRSIWDWTKYKTSSNHRLESAGLKAVEELLFKMLGIGSARLCRHNFDHNTISGASGIMLA